MKKLLGLCLALSLAAAPAVGQKKWKQKEKRFEPVVKEDIRGYAGRYVGVEDSYWLDVRADDAGRMTVTLYEEGRAVALRDLRLDGARLTATKVYDDGRTAPFAGAFANRILNGRTAFGVMVDGPVKIAEDVIVERIFYLLR
jgi:hypothetical protein